jgi:hypothetical protein
MLAAGLATKRAVCIRTTGPAWVRHEKILEIKSAEVKIQE